MQSNYKLFFDFYTKFITLVIITKIYLLFYFIDIKAKINNALANKTTYSAIKSISFKEYYKDL